MKDHEDKKDYYQQKIDTEIKAIFGVNVIGQKLFLRKTRRYLPFNDFIEIPNLTREIQVPNTDRFSADKQLVTARMAVGFRISKSVLRTMTFRCDIPEIKQSYSTEKNIKDSFWQKDYNELLSLFRHMDKDYYWHSWHSVVLLVSALRPLPKNQNVSEREFSIPVGFINNYILENVSPLKGVSKISYKNRGVSRELYNNGYIPKLWTLKDLAAWLLVADRLPTLKEARVFQGELQIKNNQLYNTPGQRSHERE